MWITQPLQKKINGKAADLWTLCAESDEGGGFYAGCTHEHSTAEEAQKCLEARKYIGEMTGFPLKFDRITINGFAIDWVHDDPLTYEEICRLANEPEYSSCVYSAKLSGDLSRSGILHKGQSVRTCTGMNISCIVTGSA